MYFSRIQYAALTEYKGSLDTRIICYEPTTTTINAETSPTPSPPSRRGGPNDHEFVMMRSVLNLKQHRIYTTLKVECSWKYTHTNAENYTRMLIDYAR